MIRKLLIANRGEIARRVIRTCKQLDIATVAVYSEADVDALHVKEADEAVLIGPAPVAQSYLQIEKIVQAALETGADAVHPGYGLLSENGDFAEACITAGLIFVGPTPDAMRQMGSKVAARAVVQAAGAPIVPGSEGALATAEEAVSFAETIGFPVMLKASFGGGGIGMQVVETAEELAKAFISNQGRAKAYFGNGEMFIEKRIVAPRHVEIQVFFDGHGNGLYLWDRECSIQRRNQKVVEEAVSAFVDDDLRRRMGEAAVGIGRAIGYRNAGTIEFLVDEDKHFYFLEMNTRLQVEHPVTEAVTGLDLVALQLRVASGEKLPITQADVLRLGHAIEVRVYAEDPVKMLPSPGTITKLVLPRGEGVRNDVAVTSGSQVTPYYDPMIGKLIVHGQDRLQAIERMHAALLQYEVEGIKTNLPLLRKIIASEPFRVGDTTTDFIEKHRDWLQLS